MKILRTALIALVALVVLAMAAVYLLSERALRASPPGPALKLATPTAAQLADGPRQLRVLGCLSCHGPNLRGDVVLDDPAVGRVVAPNIPALATRMSDAQLDRAIRGGIGHDGLPLMVMPSPEYQFLTDQETAALVAAIRRLPNNSPAVPEGRLGPLGRLGLALGKFKNAATLAAEYRASPLPRLSADTDRGRHIAQTNCSECHGPRLEGREVKPGSVSPNLDIAGAYDLPAFTRLLREGVAPGKKLGMMGEVARSDFKHLTDEEIAALHRYLQARASGSTAAQ